jgi:hypothetical protein
MPVPSEDPMSVGQRQPPLPGGWKARVRAVAATVPHIPRSAPPPPPAPPPEEDPSILGFPAEVGEDDAGVDTAPTGPLTINRAAHSGRVVVLRRADPFGAVLLVLAGVAAGLALWFPWVRGERESGLALVRRGLDVLVAGGPGLSQSGLWQPLAVVLGGGLLLLLGLPLFLPAYTHRFVGLLAFAAAELAAAGVLTLLADSGWSVAGFDRGLWFAAAVPVLGLLGALKAMLTSPRLPSDAAE